MREDLHVRRPAQRGGRASARGVLGEVQGSPEESGSKCDCDQAQKPAWTAMASSVSIGPMTSV
jgi:hypothetical protein